MLKQKHSSCNKNHIDAEQRLIGKLLITYAVYKLKTELQTNQFSLPTNN